MSLSSMHVAEAIAKTFHGLWLHPFNVNFSSAGKNIEQRSGKKIPQLGEQANQSCRPLKVSSDIVANHPGILPGTNPADYMHEDDAHFDIMEVDVFKYEYGKPLVKDGTTLTTMMRRFHDWYMETYRKSGKKIDTLTLKVKEEHDLVGIELLSVPFEEFFQFFNQKALVN